MCNYVAIATPIATDTMSLSRDQIDQAVKDMDRKKKDISRIETGQAALEITSSLGVNTPVTLLADIRQCIVDLNNSVIALSEDQMRCHADVQRMHQESLAAMFKLAEEMRNMSRSSGSPSVGVSQSASQQKADVTYWHRGTAINTGPSMIGCIFLQLDSIIQKEISLSAADSSDVTPMELKDWTTVVTIMSQIPSTRTQISDKLVMPKIRSGEAEVALPLVASTVSGRTTVCSVEHIKRMVDECPSITSTVEEVRRRVIMCPGILSIARMRRMMAVKFPYVTGDNTLDITEPEIKRCGSRAVNDAVKKLKIPQKKVYARLILEEGMVPISAANTARNSSPDSN